MLANGASQSLLQSPNLRNRERAPSHRAHFRQPSSAVALLEFLLAAARARIVAAHVLERVANRLLRLVVAMRTVDVAMVMMMVVMVVMVVIVIAIWAVHVVLLGHGVTPESNRRELCRHRAQYARCHRIKIRS